MAGMTGKQDRRAFGDGGGSVGERCGLVLEGGAMRGLFTAGVLDAWAGKGVEFDGAVGVSAGACFGCNWKSGQAGRVIRYNTRFAKDWRYCSWRSWALTGDLFGAEFCYRTLPRVLDPFDEAAFEANPMEFWVVATDAESGEAVYRRLERVDGEALEWIRASASMPMVSRPVEIGGRRYLDGGISDAVPLAWFEGMGYGKNVVVATRPKGYRKGPARGRWLLRAGLRGLPAVREALLKRHEGYNRAMELLEAREREGRALVVAPPEALPIGHVCHDAEKMRRVYEIGRKAGEEALARVREFSGA